MLFLDIIHLVRPIYVLLIPVENVAGRPLLRSEFTAVIQLHRIRLE